METTWKETTNTDSIYGDNIGRKLQIMTRGKETTSGDMETTSRKESGDHPWRKHVLEPIYENNVEMEFGDNNGVKIYGDYIKRKRRYREQMEWRQLRYKQSTREAEGNPAYILCAVLCFVIFVILFLLYTYFEKRCDS